MSFLTGGIDEFVRGLGIARAAPIPCRARSYTRDEARAEDWKEIGWKLFVLIAFAVALAWFSSRATIPNAWLWSIGSVAFVGAFVAFMTWQRLRNRRGYRDPCVEIEVADEGLTIVSPSGTSTQAWNQVVVTELLSVATKSSRSFLGIVLETSLGPIRLENDWYKDGRAAAGAILKRQKELGLVRS